MVRNLKTQGQVTQCVQEEAQIKKSWVQRSCLYSTSRDNGQSSFIGLWLYQNGGKSLKIPLKSITAVNYYPPNDSLGVEDITKD